MVAPSDALFCVFCVWGLLCCDQRQIALTLVSSATAWGAKRVVHWPRPNGTPKGFPSGHTQLVYSVLWMGKGPTALVWGAAIAMPVLRVWEGKHSVAQVVASALWPLPLALWVRA